MTKTSVPQTKPPGTGWQYWVKFLPSPWDENPHNYRMIEAWRKEWQEVVVLRPSKLHPAFNVANLLWRPLPGPKLEPEVMEHAKG